jgi:hypothetical protein
VGVHWTYERTATEVDLEQGDILAPSSELKAILSDVHPHFCHDKYLGFVVATQSCDLVRRKGEAKARYISIASVRSLKDVLPGVLEDVASAVGAGLFRASSRLEARRFLERLFDQNEQSLGMFYLHPDADIGLGEPSVAFLRVKVALREQHYPVLVRSRSGRLAPEFRAKFGWLVGNLYSRAASPDWADRKGGEQELRGLVERFLSEQPETGPMWIDDALIDAAKEAGVTFDGRNLRELVAELQAHRPKPKIDQVADAAAKLAERLLPNDHRLRAIRTKLNEVSQEAIAGIAGAGLELEGQLRTAAAKIVDAAIEETRGDPEAQLRVYRTKLLNDGVLKKLIK